MKIFRIIILPFVSDGCETSLLTLTGEHRLRMSENRVLRRKFEPKKEVVVKGWIRLHNEVLHNLYASPNIIRVIKCRSMS
jgi:hypothetical protein